jgi:hypothetical protein
MLALALLTYLRRFSKPWELVKALQAAGSKKALTLQCFRRIVGFGSLEIED